MNEETDYGIDGMDNLIMAVKKVSSIGRALVESSSQFAEDLLSLAERNDELKVARADLVRATENVENIKETLEALQQDTNNYNSNMNSISEDYYNKINELNQNFQDMTEEMRMKFIEEIQEKYDEYAQKYNEMRDSYLESFDKTLTAVQDKIYGLNVASMTQRTMLMVLFRDFCDTLFYHSFSECNEKDVPIMGDDFDELLRKLSNIEWDSITSITNLPRKYNV